jgi:hypothetical protein
VSVEGRCDPGPERWDYLIVEAKVLVEEEGRCGTDGTHLWAEFEFHFEMTFVVGRFGDLNLTLSNLQEE